MLCSPESIAVCEEMGLGRGTGLVLKQHREQNPSEQPAASWGGDPLHPLLHPPMGQVAVVSQQGSTSMARGEKGRPATMGESCPSGSTGAGLGPRCSPAAQLLADQEPKPSAHTWGSGTAGRAGTKELFAAAVNGSLASDLFCLGAGIVLGQEVPVTLWSAARFQAEVQEAAMALFS